MSDLFLGEDTERLDPVDPLPWPAGYPPVESFRANLEWRYRVMRNAKNDPSYALALTELCRRDMGFWWAGFCWLYEVRNDRDAGAVIPFIPWDYQRKIGADLASAIHDRADICIPKSRDMGLTWIALLTLLHRWLFQDGFTAILASLKEKAVDQRGNMSTMFEKLRFNVEKFPPWMLPTGFDWNDHDKNLLLKNPANNAGIEGASTTGDIGRSGRYNVILLDEYAAIPASDQLLIEASTADAAASRWYISTPRGDQNNFFKKANSPSTRRRDVHWFEHPYKGYGAYCEVSYQDGIVRRGRVRSPWYDREVKRRDLPEWIIAQELDISFTGSVEGIFDSRAMQIMRDSVFDPMEKRFADHRQDGEAALLIWEHPRAGQEYIIGADPSGGTAGGSHTAAQILAFPGLRQVAEYQGRIGLDVLPTLLYYLGKMYNWAYQSVENNIGVEVLSNLFNGHIDRRGIINKRDERVPPYPPQRLIRHTKNDGTVTETLGVHTSGQTKHFMVYSLLEPAIRNGDLELCGLRTISELQGFRDEGVKLHNPDGDDLVMALAIAMYGHRFLPRATFRRPAPFLAG